MSFNLQCGCPDVVFVKLASIVAPEVEKVIAIESAVAGILANPVKIERSVVSDITAIVSDIPTAVSTSLVDLVAFYACPLSYLAFPELLGGVTGGLTQLDPSVFYREIKELIAKKIAQIRRAYEDALRASPHFKVILPIKQFVDEMRRINFDVASFANAVAISAAVLAYCPHEGNNPPYSTMRTLISNGFTMVGGVPAGLGANFAAVVAQLQLAEAKIAAWKVASI